MAELTPAQQIADSMMNALGYTRATPAPEQTPHVELRAAAARLRHTAEAATPGPWSVGNGEVIGVGIEQTGCGTFRYKAQLARVIDDDDRYDDEGFELLGSSEDDATWIALAHPGLAEPLADLLELLADVAEQSDLRGYRAAVQVDAALLVARAIGRET